MLLFRSHLDVRRPGALRGDNGPAAFEGGEGWTAAVLRTKDVSILCVAAYMECAVGFAGSNARRALGIQELAKSLGIPLIVGADWNMQPEVLSAWLEDINGGATGSSGR